MTDPKKDPPDPTYTPLTDKSIKGELRFLRYKLIYLQDKINAIQNQYVTTKLYIEELEKDFTT